MISVYLGLGTNLGDREANLHTAARMIQERIGELVSLSSFYETEPWGFDSEHAFLNAAACVRTSLSPAEILHATQQIEREMGRETKSVQGIYADRPIDIDLLLAGDLVIDEPDLTIPHPLMTQRPFVMLPLSEIAGDIIHPLINKPLKELVPASD